MTDNPHKNCNLARATDEQIREITLGAIEHDDLTTAFHCAQHHMINKHAGLGMDKVPFFRDRTPYLFLALADQSRQLHNAAEGVTKPILDRFAAPSMPPDVRLNAIEFRKVTDTLATAAGALGFLNAISMRTWVDTRAQGCIFSLVDPNLCKE